MKKFIVLSVVVGLCGCVSLTPEELQHQDDIRNSKEIANWTRKAVIGDFSDSDIAKCNTAYPRFNDLAQKANFTDKESNEFRSNGRILDKCIKVKKSVEDAKECISLWGNEIPGTTFWTKSKAEEQCDWWGVDSYSHSDGFYRSKSANQSKYCSRYKRIFELKACAEATEKELSRINSMIAIDSDKANENVAKYRENREKKLCNENYIKGCLFNIPSMQVSSVHKDGVLLRTSNAALEAGILTGGIFGTLSPGNNIFVYTKDTYFDGKTFDDGNYYYEYVGLYQYGSRTIPAFKRSLY
ncbi:MAG: hypothetical protein FWD33_00840 [Alphaproteobacteria bacterium]|nr:hypothetical protein [Alphaproteobacteria bacterium]